MPTSKLRTTALGLVLCVVCPAAPPAEMSYLTDLDLKHSFCDEPLRLGIARDFFVEIANELPGKGDYNELVRYYRAGEWEKFAEKLHWFRRVHGKSRLMEAVSYLAVQATLEELKLEDDDAIKSAEQQYREVSRLYPGSSFAPVLAVSLADVQLKLGVPQRAFSLLETARRGSHGEGMNCVLTAGVGESQFLLRDWTKAREAFNSVLEKCGNPRLRASALMRLADTAVLDEQPDSDKTADSLYDKLMDEYPQLVNRFLPSAFANFGERQFRSRHFPEARFYFKEYRKYASKSATCHASIAKRLADVELALGSKKEVVIGRYLEVRDLFPDSDPGRFSLVRALLLSYPEAPRVERERRIRVIDSEIEKIRDESFRRRAFLEKGLAMLGSGDARAVGYLERYRDSAGAHLDKGAIGEYLRYHLLRLLEREMPKEGAVVRWSEVFGPIEASFPLWLRGTADEAKARALYQRLVTSAIEISVASGRFEDAIAVIRRWRKSALWEEAGVPAETQARIGAHLIWSLYFESENADATKPELVYTKEEKILRDVVDDSLPLLWAVAAVKVGDIERAKLLSNAKGFRNQVENGAKVMPDGFLSAYWLAAGELDVAVGALANAERDLAKVDEPVLKGRAQILTFDVLKQLKQYDRAFVVGESVVKLQEGDTRAKSLETLRVLVRDGTLWGRAESLLALAKKSGLEGKALVPYQMLAGRADAERGRCKDATPRLQAVFDSSEGAEARFRLGKCLAAEKKTREAHEIFDDVVKLKDAFWSPLAQGEIRGLEARK